MQSRDPYYYLVAEFYWPGDLFAYSALSKILPYLLGNYTLLKPVVAMAPGVGFEPTSPFKGTDDFKSTPLCPLRYPGKSRLKGQITWSW